MINISSYFRHMLEIDMIGDTEFTVYFKKDSSECGMTGDSTDTTYDIRE